MLNKMIKMNKTKTTKQKIQRIVRKKDLAKEITCMHCHQLIVKPEISGLFLVCPHCKKLVNGQYRAKDKEYI